ncbi:MAG: hypothetical protein R3C01_08055 [Planctomycetaceae bacterium]
MSPKKWLAAGLFSLSLCIPSTVSAQFSPFENCNCQQPQMGMGRTIIPRQVIPRQVIPRQVIPQQMPYMQPQMQMPFTQEGMDPCNICPQQVFAPQPIMAPVQQPVYQTYMQPQVQTQYRQKQIIRYKQVPRVQHQRQGYVENVPVTSYQTVQVDEGSYQQVWVPKMVQKQVPQTVYVPQTRYRDVAVQTMEQVPVAEITYVPEQTVTYVPQTQAVGMQTVGSQVIGWQQGGPQVAGWGYAPTTAMSPWQTPYGVPMTAELPYPTLMLPGEPYVPQSAGIDRPTPDPAFLQPPATESAEWSTIKSRSAASNLNAPEQQTYNPQPTRTSALPSAAVVR